jgi:hypothetical protein
VFFFVLEWFGTSFQKFFLSLNGFGTKICMFSLLRMGTEFGAFLQYLHLNGSERNYEVPSVFSSTKCLKLNSAPFCLQRIGSERNYEVQRVFIFCEKVQNRITSFFIFRRMDWNRIPTVEAGGVTPPPHSHPI